MATSEEEPSSSFSSSEETNRLADYFAVLEIDESQIRDGSSVGQVRQRFPTFQWPDVAFPDSLQVFSFPQGWTLTRERPPPAFFVVTLTDLLGAHQYACCLQIYEPCTVSIDDLDEASSSESLFKPKVLLFLTRFAYFELFRVVLNRVHEALSKDDGSAEGMVATIVSGVTLAGREPISFSLAGERLSVRALVQPSLPITATRVAKLVRQLGGIHNLLTVVNCAISDQKIVFFSSSLSRLADASHALRSLIFPFEYSGTCVTVLPEFLLEYAESPTPYIMGVLLSCRDKLPPLEAAKVDLDLAHVELPSGVQLAPIPEPFHTRLVRSLQWILCPTIFSDDDADPPSLPPSPSDELLDKLIRACFMRFFAELLNGYRSCLELVRLHSTPLIVFHKAAYLGMRLLSEHQLFHQIIGSQMFQMFIANRGLPYRSCDAFDELVANISEIIDEEVNDRIMLDNIKKLAVVLLQNEHQESPFSSTRLPLDRTASNKAALPAFRLLNAEKVNAQIGENLTRMGGEWKDRVMRPPPSIVPVPAKFLLHEEQLAANSRRLEVLSTCLSAIFDGRLAEARKLMCAVELSMRNVGVRVALCQQLTAQLNPIHRGTLQPQQFELVVRLLNCALDQESEEDEHGIAYACLFFSHNYCRRLSQGVHQFAYTCIQEHKVWRSQRFWEAAFFHDVHQLMRRQYISEETGESNTDATVFLFSTSCPFDMWNLLEEPTAMQLAASRLAMVKELPKEEVERLRKIEETIVYGQAKHYINLMVYLRVPLDASRLRRIDKNDLETRGKAKSRENLDAEEESSESDAESGFIENVNDGDLGTVVVKEITRIVDKICCQADLDTRLVDKLVSEVPGFVALHIDNLEQVYFESKRLSPVAKPKLLVPVLYTPSERLIYGPLRVFLLSDMKEMPTNTLPEGARNLLPAEGALFLTNYRLIFKGRPCNPFMNEEVVIRSLPLMAIAKDKTISDQLLHSTGQLEGISTKTASGLHDCVQYRTASFQLMRLIFDEEVKSEQVDELSKLLVQYRWPMTIPHSLFAYSAAQHALATMSPIGGKSKYNTIRELKKTIKGTIINRARAPATLVPALLHKSPKLGSLPPRPWLQANEPAHDTLNRTHTSDYLDLSDVPDIVNTRVHDVHKEYLADYDRLHLSSTDSPFFRLSVANSKYELCKSYPSLLVIPQGVSDEALSKVAKGFKHGRFPVVVWQNSSGALLIRGAGIHAQNMVTKLKKQANLLDRATTDLGVANSRISVASKDSGNTPEIQEQYLSRFVSASPSSYSGKGLLSISMTSLVSLDSLLTSDAASMAGSDFRRGTHSVDLSRHAANFVRNSGGKPGNKEARAMEAKVKTAHALAIQSLQLLERKALYIIGEKSQSKALKLEKNSEFIPITYPTSHAVKVSFKKMLRVMCPSAVNKEETALSFYPQLDECQWLSFVSQLLSLSTSLVNLIDLHNSSVMLCLEDGWDATCQLSSLTQLLLDPFYRTIEGFKILVQKEWLAFGYRFSHRGNHTLSSQSSGLAPMFLLFLDAVHQVLEQCPGAFEFNGFYLRFLAYHSMSAFFRTFLLDSEAERVRIDSAAPDLSEKQIASIWNYIKEKEAHCPIFYNFLYVPEVFTVLQPSSCIAALKMWSFYTEDFLSHGSPYDIEMAEAELLEREEESLQKGEMAATGEFPVKVVDATQKCLDLVSTDEFSSLLERYSRIKTLVEKESSSKDADGLIDSWQSAMNEVNEKLVAAENVPTVDELDGSDWGDQLQRAMSKRATVRLLMRGIAHQNSTNTVRNATIAAVQPKWASHRFEYQYMAAKDERCVLCKCLLTNSAAIKSGLHCRECGAYAHEKCAPRVTWPCGSELQNPSTISHSPTTDEFTQQRTLSISGLPRITRKKAYIPGSTHSGYLQKRGAKLKMWSPRFFILDPPNQKIFYFEHETEDVCKGHIDISELTSVEVEPVSSGAHMRRGAYYLTLRMAKKSVILMSDNQPDADMWKEALLAVFSG